MIQMAKVVLIQRFFANFREGLFDKLNDELDFSLIAHNRGFEKIKVPNRIKLKPYVKRVISFRVFRDYIYYPFLFWHLIFINPKFIVTEGGKNTINNVQILIYCLLFRKKYIVWDLGKGYIKDVSISILKKPYLAFQNLFYGLSKKIFTYNEQGSSFFKNKFPKKEVVVLQNTVDTNKIDDLLLVKSKFPTDVPVLFKNKRLLVGYVGALNKKKNVESLKILESADDVGLVIIGDGKKDYVDSLKSTFKNIDCVFVGYKSLAQLNDYYAIIDVVIMPGLGGLTIPQSYAFGTCVIAVEADGTEKEIIKNSENGYILNNLLTLPGLLQNQTKGELKKMGIIGKQKVDEDFSMNNYCNRFKSNL
jgi:hypothetical protein